MWFKLRDTLSFVIFEFVVWVECRGIARCMESVGAVEIRSSQCNRTSIPDFDVELCRIRENSIFRRSISEGISIEVNKSAYPCFPFAPRSRI